MHQCSPWPWWETVLWPQVVRKHLWIRASHCVYQLIHQRCSNRQGRARAVPCAAGAASVPRQHGEAVWKKCLPCKYLQPCGTCPLAFPFIFSSILFYASYNIFKQLHIVNSLKISTQFHTKHLLYFLTYIGQALGGSMNWKRQYGATGKILAFLISVVTWEDSLYLLLLSEKWRCK